MLEACSMRSLDSSVHDVLVRAKAFEASCCGTGCAEWY